MQASMLTSTIPFPDEIISHILHFLDPYEVIQLRLVSKQFSGVTRDAQLWRALYTTSRLPRPSGPFPRQSTQFLERVLIHSARVSQTWTSQPISVFSRIYGPRLSPKPSPVSTSFDFLFGRLFIWCEGEQLLAQNLETGVGWLLWESTEPIASLDACSLPFPDAERVFIAIRNVDEPVAQRTPIKLLEFLLQDDVRLPLGPVTSQMDLPQYANFPLSASAPFLYFNGGMDSFFGHFEPMVMDARTRATYRFPVFSSSIDAVMRREPHPWWPGFTVLSGEYIIVFRPWRHWDPPTTLIQAFVAPDSLAHQSDTDTDQLLLTHEALVEHYYAPTHALRSAIVDLATGETNIRCLSAYTHREQTHYSCVDITIPPINSRSTELLPMFVNAQELLVLPGQRDTVFLDASDDGHGRGILTLSLSDYLQLSDYPLVLYKVSIDASGEQCTAVVSEPSIVTRQDVFQYTDGCVFDGVRGRFCHDLEASCRYYDLVVLNLH